MAKKPRIIPTIFGKKGKDIPYFGLHGTSKTALLSIGQTKYAHLEIATFFHKPESKNFIADLYALCGYPITYAFRLNRVRNDPGGIMILKLEDRGENIADEWEPLKGTSGILGLKLGFDNPKEEDMINSINLHYERSSDSPFPARADLNIKPQNFDQVVKGVYQYSQATKYLDAGKSDMGRTILAERFLVQDILNASFKKLGVY